MRKAMLAVVILGALSFAAPAFASTQCAVGAPETAELSDATSWPVYYGQAFTVSQACTPTSAAIMVDGQGSTGVVGVDIYSDSGGSPGSSLVSGTAISYGTSLAWGTSTFSGAPQLQTATTYWLVYTNNSSNTNKVGINSASGNAAVFKKKIQSGSWATQLASRSLTYEIDGTTGGGGGGGGGGGSASSSPFLPAATSTLAAVEAGVMTTGGDIWPLFVFLGVVLAFIIAEEVARLIRKQMKANKPGTLFYNSRRGSGASSENVALTDDDEGGHMKAVEF